MTGEPLISCQMSTHGDVMCHERMPGVRRSGRAVVPERDGPGGVDLKGDGSLPNVGGAHFCRGSRASAPGSSALRDRLVELEMDGIRAHIMVEDLDQPASTRP